MSSMNDSTLIAFLRVKIYLPSLEVRIYETNL